MSIDHANEVYHKDFDMQPGHIGLKNIHDRIKLQFGEPYGLAIESVPGEYTNVEIKLPSE